MVKRTCGILAALTLLVTTGAWAQQGAVELGIDASVVFSMQSDLDGFEAPNVTSVNVPEPRFRVGYFASDNVEIEGSVLFNYTKFEESDGITAFDLAGGINYHFGVDPQASRFYLTAFGVWSMFDPGEGDSLSQFGLGGGVGVKVPLTNQLAFRAEADYVYGFESADDGIPASSNIAGFFGFSFFTK